MKIAVQFILSAVLLLMSCSKNCPEAEMATCLDTPPTEELCQAYFERWFFSKKSNACEMIAYSGCSEKGFDSQLDCEACACK